MLSSVQAVHPASKVTFLGNCGKCFCTSDPPFGFSGDEARTAIGLQARTTGCNSCRHLSSADPGLMWLPALAASHQKHCSSIPTSWKGAKMASGGGPSLLPHGSVRSDLEAGPGPSRWQLESSPTYSRSLSLQNSGGWHLTFFSLRCRDIRCTPSKLHRIVHKLHS